MKKSDRSDRRKSPWGGTSLRGISLVLAIVMVSGLITGSLTRCFAIDFGEVKNYLEKKYFNPLAEELGGVMSGGVYHKGENLGLPGFDIGVRVPVKNLSDDFVFKSTDAASIALVWIQAEIGLPKKFDLIVRGMSYEDISLLGFGVRYGIFKSEIPGLPSVSAVVSYNKLGYKMFDATNMNISIAASISFPVITPYLGFGIDRTEVTATDEAKQGLNLGEVKGDADGTRLELGLNISPVPFGYIYIGYALINSETGYTIGLGLQFP